MEQWKPVARDPRYIVSNHGRVRGVGGDLLGDRRNSNGYKSVRIGGRNVLVHRLVLETFVGPSDEDVRHLDGDKEHNHISNLSTKGHLMPEPATPYFLTDGEVHQLRLLIAAAAMGVPYTVGDTIQLVSVGAIFGVDVSSIERI